MMIASGSCSSNGMETITSSQECNVAAKDIGLMRGDAMETESVPRPEGCYDNGFLWFSTNTANKGNGAESTRRSICKKTGQFHS